ncbi:HD domain-containing protein [Wukongibacter sp. M2B1]|uniref:HD domain-containing protein n=1 Tax=Wukongibacter sp. M2B1 TaxID=3088895 RepID=UPI003D799693
MSKDAIMRLENTILYEQLTVKEGNDHQLSELVKKIVSNVAPVLATVGNNMPEYTLHDANHSAKVVELMSRIIPEDVLGELNIIELTLLILSGYLHDIGMTCSNEEREEIVKNDKEYEKLIIEDINRKNLLNEYKKEGDYRAVTIIENQLFTEYLRRTHVKRSREYIFNNLSKGDLLLHWNDTPIYKHLISVCDSHGLSVQALNDTKKWPRKDLVRNLRVNIQYLALILRLADILDLDPERTPKCILEFTNPKDPKSIVEWKKHRSMLGWDITPEYIEFSAECTDPNSERALRQFLEWIEIERRDSLAMTLKYNDDISKKYRLDLNEPVTTDGIRSNGSYIYSDFKFELDYRRVLDILMGQRLYKNPCVAIRELLQNAFDTIKYRSTVEADNYKGIVKIELDDIYLTVEDNGMGMDENIFKNYFINVGKSYYSSSECICDKEELNITSEFGIGILSIFMIAENIVVESRKKPDNPLQPPQPILVEIPKADEYFIQKPSNRTRIGTKITLKLKKDNPITSGNLNELIKELVPFPQYPIEIHTKDSIYIYDSNNIAGVESKIKDIIYEIQLDESKEDSIDGRIFIAKGKDGDIGIRYYSSNVVAQRGFKIGLPNIQIEDGISYNYMEKLLPKWITTITSINLSKECALTLTPDRSDIVLDGKFTQVKDKIEDKIIAGVKVYLDNKKENGICKNYLDHFNDLLEEGIITGEQYIGFDMSQKAVTFILDNMPLLTLNEQGEESIVLGRSIVDAEVIVVISEKNIFGLKERKELRECINEYIGNEAVAIISQEKGDYSRQNLLEYIYGDYNGEFIFGVEGVQGSLIDKRKKYIGKTHIDGRMTFTDNIIGKKYKADILLLISSQYSSSRFLSLSYNMNHPIFTSFNIEDENLNKKYIDLLLELDKKITFILNNSIEHIIGTTTDVIWLREREINRNYNFQIINIFDKQPDLINKLDDVLLEFWRKGVEIGVIQGNLEFPSLDRNNFPWFW